LRNGDAFLGADAARNAPDLLESVKRLVRSRLAPAVRQGNSADMLRK
jgi:hypothetical protein